VPVDVIEGCTDFGVRERGPLPDVKYVAFCDAAGGTGQDSFALAICHREGDNAILDVVRERRPRFVPAAVIAELAQTLKAYDVREVQGDKFAGGFHADEWHRHDIKFKPSPYTTSLSALPLLLSGRARLLDNPTLRQQLAGLERRVHAALQSENRSEKFTAQTQPLVVVQKMHISVASIGAGSAKISSDRSRI
jgi:hypothetical protein